MNEIEDETPLGNDGPGKFLIPVAVIAAIFGACIFFAIRSRNEFKKSAMESVERAKAARDQSREMIELAPASITAPLTLNLAKSNLTDLTDGLLANLEGVQDLETAKQALPALKELATKIDAMGQGLKTLLSSERTKVDELILAQLEKINPLIEKINAQPEMGDSIQPLLKRIKDKLVSYTN